MATARSRKWLITINNPIEHGFDHARIKAAVLDLPGILYWCLCDEQGDECETLHTHVFFVCQNQLTHTQIDARFPSFHRDIARGKSSENRAYVLKDGEKFNKQPDGSYSYKDTGGHLHEGINFSDTFEEGGEMPAEQQGKSRDADKIVELIKSGATNEEIVDAVSSAYRDIEKVERVRSMYRDAQFKDSWRDLEVTYIFGKTGSGKTRSVMDKYGYLVLSRIVCRSIFSHGSMVILSVLAVAAFGVSVWRLAATLSVIWCLVTVRQITSPVCMTLYPALSAPTPVQAPL